MKVEKWAKNGQMVQNCYPLSPGGVRQPSVFVLVDRLDIFVFLIDIVFEAFADVVTQVSVNWGCWSIRINVVSEIVLLEHRI